MDLDRRRLMQGVAAAGATGLAGCSLDDGSSLPGVGGGDFELHDGPTVALEPVASGLTSPTQFVVEPGSGQRYVVDQAGTIHTIGPYGLHDELFLDFADRVEVDTEKGLLGLAFHPEYPDDPRIFVRYSAPRREGTPEDDTHTEVLAEFTTVAAEDATVGRSVDVDSERTLIEFRSPTIFHQAGTIVFGPDDYLYVAMGDGTEEQFAQDVTQNLLGGIHRIDVDSEDGDRPYGIPDDNPLVGEEGRDEYYAWGLRNPWRMSFNDGDLYVGDVGNYSYEEVTIVEKGGNHGWPYREGANCMGYDDSDESGEHCGVDFSTIPGDDFVDPVTEFPHGTGDQSIGFAVIGGYIYDRDDVADLQGAYVFSNYSSALDQPAGDIFVADPTDERPWAISKLDIANGPDGQVNRVINSMGRDADGHLYVLTTRVPDQSEGFGGLPGRFGYDAGEVFRIVPEGSTDAVLPPARNEHVTGE